MALSQRLEFRQSQSLVMTPQLMQAIKLLQLSNLDLVAYVDAELERNPLLERAESDEAEGGPADDRDEGSRDFSDERDEGVADWLDTRAGESPEPVSPTTADAALANEFPD